MEKHIEGGARELATAHKMHSLIELKYQTIADVRNHLGSPVQIRETIVGFQQYCMKSTKKGITRV